MSCRFTKSELVEVLTAGFVQDAGEVQSTPIAPDAKQIVAEGLEFDSRAIKGGEIFIALKGENTHGHQFVPTAYNNGAALVLVEDSAFLQSEYKDAAIVVPDTQKALWQLATYWRKKLALPTIAVTGSVGKTTTKEIIASLLVQKGPGCYAQKSFNNHVGVPYTILKSSPAHQWMVIEIGMNAPGEIEALSKIASPDVCVVTEVAPAHIGAFASVEEIAVEKLAIVKGARPNAPLIVNGDNQIILNTIQKFELAKRHNVVTVGTSPTNTIIIDKIRNEGVESVSFRYNGLFDAYLAIPGTHSAKNAAIACAAVCALFAETSQQQLQEGLKRFVAPLMRLNLKTTKTGIALLDDSYNANPASMRAMLDIAQSVKQTGKRIGLVLGSMREMGEFAARYHNELGQQIAALDPEHVVLVGEHSDDVRKGMEGTASFAKAVIVQNPEEAAQVVTTDFLVDMVFVKGSRGIGLDRAVKILVP